MPREWCAQCHLSRTVLGETVEVDHFGVGEREYRVTRLVCGHQIVSPA